MPTDGQRKILRVAAAIAVLAFLLQPKLAGGSLPMGYHLAWTISDPNDRRLMFTTDHGTLAAESFVLTFVTVCLYLAAGPRTPKTPQV